MSGYFEQDGGRWVRFQRADGEILTLAGLWEEPNDETGGLPTFTMVTCPSNEVMAPFNDRMPIVLELSDADAWLDLETPDDHLRMLMSPCPPEWLRFEDAGPNSRKKAPHPPEEKPLGGLFDLDAS